MKLKLMKTFALSASMLFSGLAFSGSALADANQELKSYLSGLQNFTAKFEQSVFDAEQHLLQQSSGELAIARPNKLRWHVTQPDEELLISDGSSLWLYNPFLEQATVYDLEQAIAQSPFMLLTSEDDAIWADYLISKQAAGFRITPKEITNVAWLQLNLKDKVISTIEMLDSQGKRSEFKLSQFTSGRHIQPEQFRFTAPEGVDIDDQR